jgi:hypothetical protein
VLEGDSIAIYDGVHLLARIPLADLLKRHPGVDLGQIVNSAVYASIAAYSLGKKPRDIHRSLSSFSPAPRAPKRNRKTTARARGGGTPRQRSTGKPN